MQTAANDGSEPVFVTLLSETFDIRSAGAQDPAPHRKLNKEFTFLHLGHMMPAPIWRSKQG